MTAYRVIGVDPSLTNTGMVVLESSGPGRYEIIERTTIKSDSKQAIELRLKFIATSVREFAIHDGLPADAIVLEDPLDQVWVHKNKNPRSIAVMGAAVGAVIVNVMGLGYPVHMVKTNEWMPKKAGAKGGSCFLPHQETVRFLYSQIKIPEGATEHEVCAAGVGRFWIEQRRFAERRVG